MKMQLSLLSNVVLCFVLVTSTIHQTNGEIVEIIRAEQDAFTNITGNCSAASAVCFDKHCSYCQCRVNHTFVQTRGRYGECVSNDLLVYATAYEVSFLMQNNLHRVCPYQKFVEYPRFVLGSPNCTTDHSRWIWTHYGQFLNMATLECAIDDFRSRYGYFLTMEKCDRNNQKQFWKCVGDQKFNIMQTKSGRYMYYGDFLSYVTTKTHLWPSWYAQEWKIYNTEKDVCSKAVGCDVYSDASSLLNLNITKCKQRSECSGQKEISLSKTNCVLSPNKTQYLHNDTWKPLEIKNGSFAVSSSKDKVFLEWNLNKTLKSWAGLLIKVQFNCTDMTQTAKTEHCVVIKYMGTFTGFRDNDGDGDDNNGDGGDDDDDNGGDDDDDDGNGNDDGDDDDNDDDDDDDNDNDNDDDDYDVDNGNKDKDKSNINSGNRSKNNTTITVTIVCVLVVLLLSGVIVFIIFRRRKRLTRSKKNNAGIQDNTKRAPSKEEYAESMNPLYPKNNYVKSMQSDCELYESTSDNVYQDVDVNPKTSDAPTQNFTHDYALPDASVKNSQRSSVLDDAVGEKGTLGDTNCDEGLEQDRYI